MFEKDKKGRFINGMTYTMSDEHKRKIGHANKGERHGLWKGDDVGYAALHKWIERNFGRATYCDLCGISEQEISRKTKCNYFEWASRKKNYSRDRVDWMQLCKSCHRCFDQQTRAKSGYRGVTFSQGKWVAVIKYNQKQYNLGCYEDKIQAALAYDVAARYLRGHSIRCNFEDYVVQ